MFETFHRVPDTPVIDHVPLHILSVLTPEVTLVNPVIVTQLLLAVSVHDRKLTPEVSVTVNKSPKISVQPGAFIFICFPHDFPAVVNVELPRPSYV